MAENSKIEWTDHPEQQRIGTLIVLRLLGGSPKVEFFDSLYEIRGGFEEAQRQIGEAVKRCNKALLAEARSRFTPCGHTEKP